MELSTAIELVWRRAALRRHERWSRARLDEYRETHLAALRHWAALHSPFYADLHRGLEDAPLDRLPIVTKAMAMDNLDRLVTDRSLRLAEIEDYIAHAGPTSKFRGRYRVALTGGTTGRRGVFVTSDDEWSTVLASYARANDWAGIPGPPRRIRLAVVSSTNPTHQSTIVGATLASSFIPTLRVDAADAMTSIVARLNDFGPSLLVGYASILHELAAEQRGGRLHLAPRAVMSASEVLADEMRADIEAAFGTHVFNVFAATETAGIASECAQHRMHLYEDLVIVENVDNAGRPVPTGERGDRLLVTVLFNRTQPLIRYELTDSVALSAERCPDGRTFALLGSISGRTEDTLILAGRRIYPNVFHAALDDLDLGGWQVVETDHGLDVLIVRGARRVDASDVRARVLAQLTGKGAGAVAVSVRPVDDIPRTTMGKQPLIKRRRGPTN